MRFLPLTVCALLFALPAKADKFWFSDPENAKNAPAGSLPDMLSGVVLEEDATSWRIRVVGGEVVLPKTSVVKVEKDDLTVEAIVKAEKDAAEVLVAANRERELQQQIARKEREIQAAEASVRRSAARAEEAAAPAAVQVEAFDPVVGVAMTRGDLLRELRLAYEQTRDRDYLRAIRQLRRQN